MQNIELIPINESRFHAKKEDGTTYSVVDFGELMKSIPNADRLKDAGLFMGWEAMLLKDDKFYPDITYRANTWEELKKML